MEIFKITEQSLIDDGFEVVSKDFQRPWGGFLVINENQTKTFVKRFFKNVVIDTIRFENKISPKILLVASNQRLSWQYHHRRSEIWEVVKGRVGVITSDTDTENELQILNEGDWIKIAQGERHRLIGLDEWGIVAEIWQHTNDNQPSNEDDIVRVQDDFGR